MEVVVAGAVVVVLASGAVLVVVEVGTVVVVSATTVVVVVEGGTTEPLPQQPIEAFQCFQPPLEYTSQAATAVLAAGSWMSVPGTPAAADRADQ